MYGAAAGLLGSRFRPPATRRGRLGAAWPPGVVVERRDAGVHPNRSGLGLRSLARLGERPLVPGSRAIEAGRGFRALSRLISSGLNDTPDREERF